ncbi:TIGR04255 family protein [Burkholderia sp. AU31624]|uniref:TIGR04255 family protein n=1 Tax=Burkholderia sp. AU31624 TaxID=2879629 RepID=UPI001CF4A752|nr:TIGR04255 family protein [Burkholderia sp. AU31624]MCA8258719.1 TIGR04255 family protein [Burkholderia sp. AU31624]
MNKDPLVEEIDDLHDAPSEKRVLNIPPAAKTHFPRNLIGQAVCELRFPTIFEIEDRKPPAAFWKTMKHSFPLHDVLNNVNVGPGSVVQVNAHQFRSKQGRWVAVLRPSAITLETSRYTSFEEFEQQLKIVVDAAERTIDSDFFTRVGLRYINRLPCKVDEVDGWLNESLARPLSDNVFGDVSEYWQQTRGQTYLGGFLFQHGIALDAKNQTSRNYILDFDLYREDVDISEAMDTIRKLHELEFSLFSWALGDKARHYLQSDTGTT